MKNAMIWLFPIVVFLSACSAPTQMKSNDSNITNRDAPTVSREVIAGNSAAFNGFVEATVALHQALAELGYDTSEGDHSVGTAQSFLAEPIAIGRELISVNTAWKSDYPLGDYRNIRTELFGNESVPIISRLDAVGPWFNCNNLLIEFLSYKGTEPALELMRSVREKLQC